MRTYIVDYDKTKGQFTVTAKSGIFDNYKCIKITYCKSFDYAYKKAYHLYKRYNGTRVLCVTLLARYRHSKHTYLDMNE